jgi:hypothetical protein
MRGGALLSLVSHDLQGDWQFLHDEDAEEEGELRDTNDALLICLEDVVARFPEVEQLADLPVGWIAWREGPTDPWVREPRPAEWPTE